MALFDQQLQFIDGLETQIYQVVKDTVERYSYVLKDYVINKQLFREGVDGNNVKLEGYSRTTIKLKIAKGAPFDRTTLRDKADFYLRVTIDAYDDRFEVSNNVSYGTYLIKRYGKAILLPSFNNTNDFAKTYILPAIKNKLNDKFTK